MAVHRPLPLLLFKVALLFAAASSASDADVLLQFKAALSDPSGALTSWAAASPPCDKKKPNWAGVICDADGSVSGLRLEKMSLSGSLSVSVLGSLPRLRALSFMDNSFEGPIPDIGKVASLRAVYLSMNKFSGEIPDDAFAGMTWLKKLYLSRNGFSGPIPKSVAKLPKLLELRLDENRFSGAIPEFQSKDLKLVNVSNNDFEGSIPANLRAMNAALFSGNKGLCGDPLGVSCSTPPPSSPTSSSKQPVVFGAIAFGILTAIVAVLFIAPRRKQTEDGQNTPPDQVSRSAKPEPSKEEKLEEGKAGPQDGSNRGGRTKKAAAKEPEQGPKLVFVKERNDKFELKDLLKSSAEVLGPGNFGCSYKASLTSGIAVVVKRFRHMNKMGKEDFDEHMRRLGRLSHPNLLSLVAYYYRKDEKLMVTDYVPKRSLANVLHGSRVSNNPSLNWSARLKIVKGIAKGLNYLYEELQMLSVPHGQLKSSNVLLSDSLEPLLTDYALVPAINQAQAEKFMVAYKSPECKQNGKASKKSDVWSLGVLILEIMTGKIPTTELQQDKGGVDLAGWVSSVAQEDWAGKVLDKEMKATKNSEEDMTKLLQIGLACCDEDVEKRWELEEVLDRLEELRELDGEDDCTKNVPAEGETATVAAVGDDLATVDIN